MTPDLPAQRLIARFLNLLRRIEYRKPFLPQKMQHNNYWIEWHLHKTFSGFGELPQIATNLIINSFPSLTFTWLIDML